MAMAGRLPEPTLRYLTRQQPDTEKIKNAQRTKEIFANAFGTFGFPDTQSQRFKTKEPNQPKPTHHPKLFFKMFSNFVTE